MKTQLIVLLLVVLLFSMSNAQENADTLNIFKTNSLQFRVNTFISLSSFKGALLSYKYHCSDENAWRFGVSVRGSMENEDAKNTDFRYDSTMIDQQGKADDLNIQLIAQYLNYINAHDEIKLFYAIGPYFSMYLHNYKTDQVNITLPGNGVSYLKKQIRENYQIGFTGSLGVEWFFRSNMSLHAEYGFNAYYFIENDEYERIYNNASEPDRIDSRSIESDGWGIDDSSALLGLSVYF